jgi:hypothetical protein
MVTALTASVAVAFGIGDLVAKGAAVGEGAGLNTCPDPQAGRNRPENRRNKTNLA